MYARPDVVPSKANPPKWVRTAPSMRCAASSNRSATACTAAASTNASRCAITGSTRRLARRFRLVRGTYRFGDVGGEPVSDVLVVGFHHDPDHLFGSGGAQQNSAGVAQFLFGLLNRVAHRRRGNGSDLVGDPDVDQHLRQGVDRRGKAGRGFAGL